MSHAKRFFFIGIAVFETLTVVMGLVVGELCSTARQVVGRDFTTSCLYGGFGSIVEVKCHGKDWTTVPDFSGISVFHITFINCSFAENTSIHHIFHSMNITLAPDISEIRFEDLRSSLSRQNFQDLLVPILTFTDTKFNTLLFDTFYDALEVTGLNIQKTNLDRIPNNFFGNWSRGLHSVHLMGNKLQKIAKNDFTHLPTLRYLNLYENEITEIEAAAFDSLPNLFTLELGKNHLHTLPPGIFHHLSWLYVLHLGENSFDKLPDKLLSKNCHLKNFRMNFNRGTLKTLPDQFFKKLVHLTDVNLEWSQLELLPTNLFTDSSQLKSLNLRNNLLRSSPLGFFKNFKELARLDLSNNQIVTLPAKVFADLSNLEDLNISHNNLTFLESDVFEGLRKLIKLDASFNNLTKVGHGFCSHLQKIQMIDFSFNGAQFIYEPNFEECKTLHNINFSHNNVTKISDTFASNLAHIDLSFNNLSQLTTGDIEKLINLKTVDLRNNQISKINLTEFASTVATYKTYSDNDLPYTPVVIALGKNLLQCDCHLMDFVLYMNSHDNNGWKRYVKITSRTDKDIIGDYITCASPVEFKNRTIHEIDPGDLYCPLKTDAVDDACASDCICREYLAKKVLSVDCSFKNLTRLPSMISNAYNWSIKLNMSHNMLKRTPSLPISYLEKVISLDLSNNNIDNVTMDLFSKNLVDLKLDNNRISQLDESVIKYLTDNDILHSITLHQNPWVCDCEARDFLNFVRRNSTRPSIHRFDAIACHGSNKKLYKMTVNDICKNDIGEDIIDGPEDLKVDEPDACTNYCICREYDTEKVLYVDCSSKNLTRLPAMISNAYNWSIKLNMSRNILKRTPSLSLPYLANVTSLDLSNNDIDNVTMDLFSKNLVDLKLHNNGISRLDDSVIEYLTDNDILHSITLHKNPWAYDCEALRFLHFIQSRVLNYQLGEVLCRKTNRTLYGMSERDMCEERDSTGMIVGGSLIVAFFGIVIALYYKYNREIKVWLYSKQWCLWIVTEDELDKDKKYDAFVSFSHEDEDFVENELVAKMEDGPRPYKLCLHHRDWLAGEWILVQIRQSVEDSRRTIIVLSTNFLESVWGRLEFRVAHTQALKEGRARVIIILYGEIENMENLDPELEYYLSLNTYVKWGDPWFWDKLRYSLPHKLEPSRRRTRNTRLIEEHCLRQSLSCDNTNATAKANAISMSKLVNDSAKLFF